SSPRMCRWTWGASRRKTLRTRPCCTRLPCKRWSRPSASFRKGSRPASACSTWSGTAIAKWPRAPASPWNKCAATFRTAGATCASSFKAMHMPVEPFTPRAPLSRELLERYAQGRLTPAEEHAVELHLELDPLAREAAEGLQVPGAAQGLRTLRNPLGPVSWKGLLLLAVVAGIGVWAVYRSVAPAPADTHVSAPAQHTMPSGPEALPAAVESTLQVVDAEIIIHAQMVPEEPRAAPSAERFHGTVL